MRLYVCLEKNLEKPSVYGSISALSSYTGVNYYKLWRSLGKGGKGKYSEFGLNVYVVELIRSERAEKKSTAER